MGIDGVRALTFDVGGTIFDWQSAVTGAVGALARERGAAIDVAAFALEWRRGMFQRLARVRSGELPWANADDLHRHVLDELAPRYAGLELSSADRDALTNVWHQMEVWPDVPEALERLRSRYTVIVLTVLSWSIVVDSSTAAGISWDGILSCEFLGHYKPDREAYLAGARLLRRTPEQCMMVAAHPLDLRAAMAAGFRTAYVAPRADEPFGSYDGELSDFDVVADDFGSLAKQLV